MSSACIVADAARYGCVRDDAGQLVPVQALDAHTLVFVARDVPAFGHKTYFLSDAGLAADADRRLCQPFAAHPDGDGAGITVLENPFLRVDHRQGHRPHHQPVR